MIIKIDLILIASLLFSPFLPLKPSLTIAHNYCFTPLTNSSTRVFAMISVLLLYSVSAPLPMLVISCLSLSILITSTVTFPSLSYTNVLISLTTHSHDSLCLVALFPLSAVALVLLSRLSVVLNFLSLPVVRPQTFRSPQSFIVLVVVIVVNIMRFKKYWQPRKNFPFFMAAIKMAHIDKNHSPSPSLSL